MSRRYFPRVFFAVRARTSLRTFDATGVNPISHRGETVSVANENDMFSTFESDVISKGKNKFKYVIETFRGGARHTHDRKRSDERSAVSRLSF